jgi:small subunit ribosomal protein S20
MAGRPMANIRSQVKRIHRSERERIENRRTRSAVKTHFRRLEQALDSGDSSAIGNEHRELVSRIDKAVQNGALHPNNGARKKSRAARLLSRASA